jgi:DNA-binding beta-propeller fold protein YncE
MARLLLLSVIGAVLFWSNEPLSADSLYWAEQSGTIRSAKLDGTNQKVLVSGLWQPTSIAIDSGAGKFYWTDQGLDMIGSADLNGTH